MRTFFVPAAVAATAVLFTSPPALGDDVLGVLSVSEPPEACGDLVELTGQLRAALAERVHVVEAQYLRDRMTSQIAAPASPAELDRAYAGALALYQTGDYKGSIRTLRSVISDLEKLLDGADTFAQWSRAMLRLARAEQVVGRRSEANDLLERLVRAQPQLNVDATQYPPSFVKQVDETRAGLKLAKTRRLTVSAPMPVRVLIDGRDVGSTPITVELSVGRYRVGGRNQVARVPSVMVDLSKDDQSVVLDPSLFEALRPNGGPGLALPLADRLRRIVAATAWLGLDRAVVASLVRNADAVYPVYLQGALIDVKRGQVLREGRLRLADRAPPPGGMGALASFLISGKASNLIAATPSLAPSPAAASSPGSARTRDLTPKAERFTEISASGLIDGRPPNAVLLTHPPHEPKSRRGGAKHGPLVKRDREAPLGAGGAAQSILPRFDPGFGVLAPQM